MSIQMDLYHSDIVLKYSNLRHKKYMTAPSKSTQVQLPK